MKCDNTFDLLYSVNTCQKYCREFFVYSDKIAICDACKKNHQIKHDEFTKINAELAIKEVFEN